MDTNDYLSQIVKFQRMIENKQNELKNILIGGHHSIILRFVLFMIYTEM